MSITTNPNTSTEVDPTGIDLAAAQQVKPSRRRKRREDENAMSWEKPLPWYGSALKWLVLAGFAIVILGPVWMVFATSFASAQQVGQSGGMVLFPTSPSFQAYREVLRNDRVMPAFAISVGVTAVGTFVNTAITALAAYGLSRPRSLWHRPMLFTILFTYLFGPGMIPVYLTVQQLGLIDKLAALILPNMIAAFNLVILRGFFMGLPNELTEAARIDGASEWGILGRIILPLSKAPIAVIALFYGVGYWNNFFNAMLYLLSTEKYPLQMVLRDLVLSGMGANTSLTQTALQAQAPAMSVQMAIVVIAMVPVLIVYPFVQKHFVQGVVLGAVKG